MKIENKNNLFKVLFVWGAIIIGVLGAWLNFDILIILSILMLALVIIYIRYYTMREMVKNRQKLSADKK